MAERQKKTLEEVAKTSSRIKIRKADPDAPVQIVVGGRPKRKRLDR